MISLYCVLAWDNYYPESDNVVAVFKTEQEAWNYVKTNSIATDNIRVQEYTA